MISEWARCARALLLLAVVAVPRGAHAGYLHGLHPLPALPALPPPVVSYGYHTAVVTKPLLPAPLPHPLPLPLHHHHVPVLPPPVIIKPIATSYQSFHKIDRPVYPIHYVKPLPLHAPLHPLPLHAPLHAPLHPLPLPLAYGHHYPHYLH